MVKNEKTSNLPDNSTPQKPELKGFLLFITFMTFFASILIIILTVLCFILGAELTLKPLIYGAITVAVFYLICGFLILSRKKAARIMYIIFYSLSVILGISKITVALVNAKYDSIVKDCLSTVFALIAVIYFINSDYVRDFFNCPRVE